MAITHNLKQGYTGARRAYTPHLVGYWKCDEGTTNPTATVIKDYSGYGHDLSPLYAPTWKANKTAIAGYCCTPTQPNGFFYECTTAGATGPTEPALFTNTTPGTQTADLVAVWTCRAVPTGDMWARSGWLQCTAPAVIGTNPGVGFYAQSLNAKIRELLSPTVDGGINHATSAATISGTVSNHIDSSTSSFPTNIAIGDWLQISGFTVTTANNSMSHVSASSAAQISFDLGGIISSNSAVNTVRIRKCLAPPSLMIAFDINTNQAAGNSYSILEMCERWNSGRGRRLYCVSSRRFTHEFTDLSTTVVGGSSAVTSGQPSSGVDTHMANVVSLLSNVMEYYKVGARDSSAIVLSTSMRQYCQGVDLSDDVGLQLLRPQAGADGRVQIKNVQLYIGRGMPSGASGMYLNASPTLITNLRNGTPLTYTDWA